MGFLDNLLDGIEDGAAFGINEAAEAIANAAADADDPLQAFILNEAGNLLVAEGLDGLGTLRTLVDGLIDGDGALDPVEVRKLPFGQRAALLAAATEKEIDARKAGDAALAAVGDVLGKLVKGLLGGAFKGA